MKTIFLEQIASAFRQVVAELPSPTPSENADLALKYWTLSLKLCPKPLTAAPVLKRLAEVLEYSGDATDAFGDDERPADGEQAPRGPLQKVTVSGAGVAR